MIQILLATLLAGNQLFAEMGHWQIYDNEDSCAMMGTFENDGLLWVSHDYTLNKTTFVITDPAFKSVTDDSEYSLKLRFVGGGQMDDGWETVDATGFVTDSGKGIRFVLKGDEALDDLASNDILGVLRDEIVVSSLDLKGSALAVQKLKQCAVSVNKRNPGDPLEGADQSKSAK